jgi:hypothetical protein
MQVLVRKKSSDSAAKRAVDGLVKLMCNVDVRHLIAADQAIRTQLYTWLKSARPVAAIHDTPVAQVLSALEQPVCQQPKPAGMQPQGAHRMPPKSEPAVKAEPVASQTDAVTVYRPGDAAVSYLKDGRISQSTLDMFDLSSVLKDEHASDLLLDESKLAHMPPEKVHSHLVDCLPVSLCSSLSLP